MTTVDSRSTQLTKAFGALVKQEGLTSWKEIPHADEEVWGDMAKHYSYRNISSSFTSPTAKSTRLQSPKESSQKERRLRKKTADLNENETQFEAKSKTFQQQFALAKASRGSLEDQQDPKKLYQIAKAALKVKKINAKVLSTSPRRAERKEIEILKEQNAKLAEELKTKETRNRLVVDKLNRTIARLKDSILDLQACRVKHPTEAASIQTEDLEVEDMMGFHFVVSPTPQVLGSSVEDVPSELGLDPYDNSAVGTAKKTMYPNGFTVFQYANLDVKRVFPDGKITYYSSSTQALQTVTPEGIKYVRFPNGQVEKTYSDGSVKVTFPNGTVKWISSEGELETIYSDGVRVKRGVEGKKTIIHPSGIVIEESKVGKS
mmetsp:Transcript_8623/g.16893  ORF Transcript_8623/g.16893 Transcript_8623/m.16893 type:complete len:375 (+) Transcript_8623:95-1219(+)